MNVVRSLLLAAALGVVALSIGLRADDRLGDDLGTIRFEVRGKPDAQSHVVRGVKLLHHMMYPEADRAFTEAVASDDQCALAYWGRAMALLHPLWPDAPTAAELKEGADYLQRGIACLGATPRERAYLETLDVYFRDATTADHIVRLSALDGAWTKMIAQYPDDMDALAFSALFHLAPARFQPKDKSHRLQLESAARLQDVLAKIPAHPGGQHYKIHAYDFPLLADRALEVCETYGGIAPDVPHALHMPTHIFTRRGMWEKSIEFNLRSAAAARKLGVNAGALNGHYPHALDYMVYAYLQRGQYQEADAIRQQITTLNGPYSQVQPTAMAFAFAAIPARCALERQNWSEAAELPLHQPAAFPWSAAYLNCDSITRFARAIGAARSGKLDAARTEIAEQEKVFQQLMTARRASYWASQAETQLLAARAWVQFAEGKIEEAISTMQRAVALEAATDKEAVTPGEVLPAGDLLGDLFLECGRNGDALATFEAVLQSSPNRLNSLYGAGLAAERAGDAAKARQYYEQLLAVGSAANSGIERVEHAKAFVARQSAGATSKKL
jgi:tetratricopeptide (TPR) repeat protein